MSWIHVRKEETGKVGLEPGPDSRKIFPYAKLDDALRDLYAAQECFDERFRIRVVGEGYVLTSDERVCDARGQGPNRVSPIRAERAAFILATKFPPYKVQD